MKIHVVFRTCDRVFSLHDSSRPFGLGKPAVIRFCFSSLIKALEGFDYSVHVQGDRLSDEMIHFFKGYGVEISNGTLGNDESIRQSLSRAYTRPDDEWVYLCEDDYVHVPEAFHVIRDLVENQKEVLRNRPKNPLHFGRRISRPLVIHPADYPDRYLPHKRKASLLYVSELAHWREISNTTFTFLAEAQTFRRYQRIFDRSATGADDRSLSHSLYGNRSVRKRVLCLSPIPGVASHMHEGVMTPRVDWRALYDAYESATPGAESESCGREIVDGPDVGSRIPSGMKN